MASETQQASHSPNSRLRQQIDSRLSRQQSVCRSRRAAAAGGRSDLVNSGHAVQRRVGSMPAGRAGELIPWRSPIDWPRCPRRKQTARSHCMIATVITALEVGDRAQFRRRYMASRAAHEGVKGSSARANRPTPSALRGWTNVPQTSRAQRGERLFTRRVVGPFSRPRPSSDPTYTPRCDESTLSVAAMTRGSAPARFPHIRRRLLRLRCKRVRFFQLILEPFQRRDLVQR